MGARYVKLVDGKGYAMRFDTPDAHVDCGDTPIGETSALDLSLPLANHPSLSGLYGVRWYLLRYAEEEDARLSAKLFRHYRIEGNRSRLTDDPYMLPHVVNPDFDDGAFGWTLEPAEPGGVTIGRAKGSGILQTRC